MSVFLMGVYDKSCDRFRTVAKCGNGHDDATITRLQHELDMVKISKVPTEPTLHVHVHCMFMHTHILVLSVQMDRIFGTIITFLLMLYIYKYNILHVLYIHMHNYYTYIYIYTCTCTMYII